MTETISSGTTPRRTGKKGAAVPSQSGSRATS